MNFRRLSIQLTAIALMLIVLLLFKPLASISQWRIPPSEAEPTYRISDDFGVVIKSENRGLAEGYFVVRDGETWMRFEPQKAPRAIPLSP